MNNYVYALWLKDTEPITIGPNKVNPFEILIQADADNQAWIILQRYMANHGLGKFRAVKVKEFGI